MLRKTWRIHRLPCLSAVRGDVKQTVVRAGPNHAAVNRRNRERRNRRVDFRSRLIEVDRTAARHLGARYVASQVRADALPGFAVIVTFQHILRADQKLLRVGRREKNRMGPAETILELE